MGNTNIHAEWWNTDAQVGRDGFCRTLYGEPAFAREYYGDSSDFTGGDDNFIAGGAGYAGWSFTAVGASVLQKVDAVGGILRFLPNANDNDGLQIQTDGEMFLPSANSDIWFEARIRGSDVTQVDYFLGLCTTDTTIIATNPADVIGFWKHDADANVDFEVSATLGAGAPVDTTSDMADNTWIRLGFWVQGLTQVVPYINGVANATATSATVANIPAVEMALAFACLTGENVANTLDIDWFRIVQLV